MNVDLNSIKETLRALPVESRSELADWLLDTVAGSPDAEWLNVAEQRFADFEQGKVVAIPADEVFRLLKSSRASS